MASTGQFYSDEQLLSSDLQSAFNLLNQSISSLITQLCYTQPLVIQNGISVAASSPADGGVQVSTGQAFQNGQLILLTAQQGVNILPGSYPNGTGLAADTTNPRIDVVYIQYSQVSTNLQTRQFNPPNQSSYTQSVYTQIKDGYTINVVHGTPAASPTVPAIPNGTYALAQVTVPANATTIVTANIADQTAPYRTDGGFTSKVTAGVLTYTNASTISSVTGFKLGFGANGYIHDNTTSNRLEFSGGTNGLTFLNPALFSATGTPLLIQPTTDSTSGTHVISLRNAAGVELSYLDNTGIFSGSFTSPHGVATDLYGKTTVHGGVQLQINGIQPPAGLAVANATSGTVGANIAANTTYSYELTAVSYSGVETSAAASVSVTTGATAYPINLTWTANSADTKYVNVYKGGKFLVQLAGTASTYQDNGNTATTSQVPPAANFTDAIVSSGGAKLSTLGGQVTWVASAGTLSSTADAFWATDPTGTIPWFVVGHDSSVRTKNNLLEDGNGNMTVKTQVTIPGGSGTSAPGLYFGSLAPAGWAPSGALGIGLDNTAGIALIAGNGGVYTTNGATKHNILDDGSGNLTFNGTVSTEKGTASGGVIHYSLQNAGTQLIGIGLNNAVGASNAGGDFNVWAYDNTGAYLGNWLSITRSSGAFHTKHNLLDDGNGGSSFNNTLTVVSNPGGGLQLYDATSGQANPSKYIRSGGGNFQLVNNAYSTVILQIDDTGSLYSNNVIMASGQWLGFNGNSANGTSPLTGASNTTRGTYIGWNATNGGGESDLYNYAQSGGGNAFSFYTINNSKSNFTDAMDITQDGAIKANTTLNSAAGVTQGTVYWVQHLRGTVKQLVVLCANFEDASGSTTIALNPACTQGCVVTNNTGETITVITPAGGSIGIANGYTQTYVNGGASQITFNASTSILNGMVIVEGI